MPWDVWRVWVLRKMRRRMKERKLGTGDGGEAGDWAASDKIGN